MYIYMHIMYIYTYIQRERNKIPQNTYIRIYIYMYLLCSYCMNVCVHMFQSFSIFID